MVLRSPIDDAGLCAGCRWSRVVPSARGSTFLRCARAEWDPSLVKYPRLPREECHGFAPGDPVDGNAANTGGDAD